jgi:hypothetical protein
LQVWVPVSQVPFWPPALGGQSVLSQQPLTGTHRLAAMHFLSAPQSKVQLPETQAAVPPGGDVHLMQVDPH